MAALVNAKTVGLVFPNQAEIIRVVWDFEVDGGAVAAYTVLTADSSCIVSLKAMVVKTAATSGGSMTVDLGKGTSGAEIVSNKAVAAMTAENLTVGLAPVQLDAAEVVSMNIEAAAATAGKVEFIFEVLKY